MQFKLLMGGIAQKLIDDPTFYPSCELAGIAFTDWPVSDERSFVEKYISLKAKHSHDYAAISLFEESQKFAAVEIPDEKELLRAVYFQSIRTYRCHQLIADLKKNPEDYEQIIANVKPIKVQNDLIHFGKSVDGYLKRIVEKQIRNENEIIIPDFPMISQMINGFNPGRVGMLVAKTGFGKTTFAINIALSASKIMSVVYLNMEMTDADFAERLICCEMNVTNKQLTKFPEEIANKIETFQEKVINRALHFSNGIPCTVQDIYAIGTQYRDKYGLGLLIVDYDQKIEIKTSKEMPEWKALQIAMENLDELSKRLNCFILVLAQESSTGDVSGSQRSKFPASSVLRFYEAEGFPNQKQYFVEALKNRFNGKENKVEVSYDGARFKISEIGFATERPTFEKRFEQAGSSKDSRLGNKGYQKPASKPRWDASRD